MRVKRVLRPERLRRVPAQFSWVDQRLVSEHHIERCDEAALAVYLFLVTVSDAQGLSYYGDAKLAKSLSMPAARLEKARADLIRLNLIAYVAPLYQVHSPERESRRGSSTDSTGVGASVCALVSSTLRRAVAPQIVPNI